jgi:CubicO group peptidase (beta-lactamase class C family)
MATGGSASVGSEREKVKQAVDAAFAKPEEMTAGFVVSWRGRLIGERYGEGITHRTPLESWSMGKSLTATLVGILIRRGVYTLDQPAPVPEWSSPGDPRSGRTLPGSPVSLHRRSQLIPLCGDASATVAAGKVGRYRNTEPVLANYLVRLGVEKLGEEYLQFPQRALFDKIGVSTMVMETDPYGNFLTQGYELASARDWARLGQLYLQDGVWKGERILPEGFVRFVSTLAPAWKADNGPVYGGFFWINGDGRFPVPKEAYYMAGAGGQFTLIIPSHDLVVARLGHYKGSEAGSEGLNRALAMLMEAVPGRK